MSLAKTTHPLVGIGGNGRDVSPFSGDSDLAAERANDWFDLLEPGNRAQAWFVEQVAATSMKIDRTEMLDEQLRASVAMKARMFWDDDRQLDAIKLGQRIADEPEAVVNQLRRTPQGCDWLIGRWGPLAKLADRRKQWSHEQMTQAQALLGQPGNGFDALNYADQRSIARQAVADLTERKAKVAGADALDRAMAEADLVDVPTPEAKRLRRYEVTLHGRLRWYLGQIPKLADKPPTMTLEAIATSFPNAAPAEATTTNEVAEVEPKPEVEAETEAEPSATRLEAKVTQPPDRHTAEWPIEEKMRA